MDGQVAVDDCVCGLKVSTLTAVDHALMIYFGRLACHIRRTLHNVVCGEEFLVCYGVLCWAGVGRLGHRFVCTFKHSYCSYVIWWINVHQLFVYNAAGTSMYWEWFWVCWFDLNNTNTLLLEYESSRIPLNKWVITCRICLHRWKFNNYLVPILDLWSTCGACQISESMLQPLRIPTATPPKFCWPYPNIFLLEIWSLIVLISLQIKWLDMWATEQNSTDTQSPSIWGNPWRFPPIFLWGCTLRWNVHIIGTKHCIMLKTRNYVNICLQIDFNA